MTEYSDDLQPKSDDQSPQSQIVTVNNAPSDHPATLWLIDDDAALRMVLADTFEDAGLTVISFTQAQAAWTRLNDVLKQQESAEQLPDVILTDIRMPMMDGLSFSDWVHQHFPKMPIVIMTAHSDLTSAINSYQTGAFEYLPKPFDLDDAVATIYKAINYQPNLETTTVSLSDEPNTNTTSDTSTEDLIKPKAASSSKTTKDNKNKSAGVTKDNGNPSGIIGQSPAMQTVFRAIGRLAQSPISVLITGESGTGKELVASALHQHSPRKQQPFIALNMAAIPHDLIESELFGHEKGAFTGATTMRQGRFEQADGGTLFLDEIGDMPFSTQTRLLRVLANGEFYRVGGQQPIKVDVRIIAATHQNLEELVKQSRFREDLFYRLNVIRLPLPPLRTRPEDIPALALYFMQSAAEQMSTTPKHLHPAALQIMQTFDWRGNVRQLENVCLWLTVMATGDTVMATDLPPELLENISPNTVLYEEHGSLKEDAQEHLAQSSDVLKGSALNNHQNDRSNQLPKSQSWQQALADWAEQSLNTGETDILQTATPEFERVLLTAALNHSGGKKIEAASLLGWGRNTLTRKLQQLEISAPRVPTKE
ncbi:MULTISPECIES: sigma 54-interacting transcriptional regulator [unclassified Psychrobacter]|mgnify:FL=1|uniref:sigma 54-interacting transcriptional regulator n=1 Tax=unclassified Psychrobacter TaxID=196806 RepID=UPI00086AA23B|nr:MULTISPECIES: sigma 54-interacting transcriptional regulator [unclassified Psychrobacter]MBA6243903.1 nitrogen regulation protein NR(I) [Psychrobacter sp. Urea-trap-18]MBA6285486.1 nitrogen regulation protein NR(I) [Psychrobacter sp. Urea-trap-16]MBA6318994.1 nitrogen regulation protein NR(I) [Psychrobacter sp. Urea-trap-20]MBA6335013.1 nitrogen regulation protein NR(I) [Psychrobacter sp. Urea-trap-19]OEH68554.1 MAG: AAA family ATPase [Psychrobacter sp. B29-1]|tara:strand:- start:24615 stop:26396 length:1782 start_codon:yes stop_codon:yes gene_type:complete